MSSGTGFAGSSSVTSLSSTSHRCETHRKSRRTKEKREPKGSRLSKRNAESDHIVSMKLRSLSERLGCLSLRTALLSI